PLLPPRRRDPGVGAPDADTEVVTVRADERETASQVAHPARGQRRAQPRLRAGDARLRLHARLITEFERAPIRHQGFPNLARLDREHPQDLEPPVHDLAPEGGELLVPGLQKPPGIRTGGQVPEPPPPREEPQPIAPARRRVRGNQPRDHSVEIRPTATGLAREKTEIRCLKAHRPRPRT